MYDVTYIQECLARVHWLIVSCIWCPELWKGPLHSLRSTTSMCLTNQCKHAIFQQKQTIMTWLACLAGQVLATRSDWLVALFLVAVIGWYDLDCVRFPALRVSSYPSDISLVRYAHSWDTRREIPHLRAPHVLLPIHYRINLGKFSFFNIVICKPRRWRTELLFFA